MDSASPVNGSLDAITAPVQVLRRDALLFLLISSAALILPPIAVAVLEQTAVGTDVKHAIAVMMCIGWAAGIVTSLLGLWKIERARTNGLNTAGAKWLQFLLWMVPALAIMAGMIFARPGLPLPNQISHSIFWSIPFIAVLVQLFKSLAKRVNRGDKAWRAFCFLAIGHLCTFYALAMAIGSDPSLLEGRISRKLSSTSLAVVFSDGYGQIAAILCGPVVAIVYALGLYNFFLTWRAHETGAARRRASRMVWLFGVLILSLAAWFSDQSIAAFFGEVVAIWTVFAAVTVGKYAARVGTRGAPSRLRRVCFTLPLLLLGCGVAVTAGIFGSAGEAHDRWYTEDALRPIPIEQRDWAWKLPDCIRCPIAAALGHINPEIKQALLFGALLSKEELKQTALSAASGSRNEIVGWNAWCQRDPESAMQMALKVPIASNPTIPETKYDFSAGFVIGACGSIEDIRQRLRDSYSDQLVDGVMLGLSKERVALFLDEIEARIEQLPRPDRTAWYTLSRANQQRFQDLVLKLIKNSSAVNQSKIAMARYAWNGTTRSEHLIRAVLNSSDVEYRKAALQNFWQLQPMYSVHDIILLAAKGKLPNSDADERRLAAFVLNGARPTMWQNWRSGAVALPLTSTESDEIQRIIDKYRAQHPGSAK